MLFFLTHFYTVSSATVSKNTCRQQFLLDRLCELFLAWSTTIFVVLKSVGFVGLISLLEFISVKNSFAGIAGVIWTPLIWKLCMSMIIYYYYFFVFVSIIICSP